jgi:hypothetical protein
MKVYGTAGHGSGQSWVRDVRFSPDSGRKGDINECRPWAQKATSRHHSIGVLAMPHIGFQIDNDPKEA